MYISNSKLKKTFMLTVFAVSSASFAMDRSDGEILSGKSTIGVDEDGVRKAIAANFRAITNKLSSFIFSDQGTNVSDNKIPEQEIKNATKIIEKANNGNPEQPVKVTWLTKENALRFGIGAVALVTVGCATYVLYKNGTLKKVSDAMKKHPYITGGSVTGTLALVGSALAYKYYYTQPPVV